MDRIQRDMGLRGSRTTIACDPQGFQAIAKEAYSCCGEDRNRRLVCADNHAPAAGPLASRLANPPYLTAPVPYMPKVPLRKVDLD